MAKEIGSIGDRNPIDYGGGVIFSSDEDGAPWVEWFYGLDEEAPESQLSWDIEPDEDDKEAVREYEKLMNRKFPVYHANLQDSGQEFLDWYDWIDWKDVARSAGQSISKYTAPNLATVMSRAMAVWDAAGHYGWHEFDGDPMQLSVAELAERWGY